MGTLTAIIGLAGSGKSHHLLKLIQESPMGAYAKDEGFLVGDVNQNYQKVYLNLRNDINVFIVEAEFNFKSQQDAFIQKIHEDIPEIEIKWLAFEKDLAKANNNVMKRTNKPDPKGHAEQNTRIFPHYNIPVGADELEIFEL